MADFDSTSDVSISAAVTVGGGAGAGDADVSIGSLPTMDGAAARGITTGGILVRVDQYELVRKLGGGGFGVVYLARDTVSGVEYALKTLHPLLKNNPEELERVRANFALTARLSHPNIAAAHVLHRVEHVEYFGKSSEGDLRVFPGDPVMLMAYAPGITLSTWRRQFADGIVPFDKAVAICSQIANALDYAHSERVVHRDIKPSNVMVETDPVTGLCRARVLDFGLAAEIRSSMSRVSKEGGDSSGTRPYMAPEQWAGKRQDGRTDQYALACMFYELVSGEVPFAGAFETGDAIIMSTAVKTELPEPLEDFPEEVNAAFAKALSKDRANRFANCGDFIRALGASGKETESADEIQREENPVRRPIAVSQTALAGKCPICGRRHRADSDDSFECRICHRDFFCMSHYNEEYNACADCAVKLREEKDHKAREEAERRDREIAERKAHEEAARKAREEAEHKAVENTARNARVAATRNAFNYGQHKENSSKKSRVGQWIAALLSLLIAVGVLFAYNQKHLKNALENIPGFSYCDGSVDDEHYISPQDKGNSIVLNAQIASEDRKKDLEPLRMITETGFPPYEFTEKDKIVGVDVEICEAIAAKLGRKLTIIDAKFDAVIPSVVAGKADFAAAGIIVTEERKAFIDFSVPYVTCGMVIVSKKGSEYRDVKSVRGKRIGVQSGTTADQFCVDVIKQNPIRFDNPLIAVDALNAGKVDLIIVDIEPATYIVKGDNSLVISSDLLSKEEFAIVIRKGNQALLSAANEVIKDLIKSGKINAWRAEYDKRYAELVSKKE